MVLANLDNEVIFKKAFTDKFVFEHFVKDILDLDLEIGRIETEKRFTPPVGYIDFRLDIFAETKDKRIVIELQRVHYDHNFDRFMHYLMMLVAEQQKSSKKYGFEQTVYLIVVMTLPYVFNDKTGVAVREEVIVTEFDSRNLQGSKIKLFEHQMVMLNPNHPQEGTPQRVRDWLDLVYQSIHSPRRPNINLLNPGIKRAADLIEVDNLDPYEQEKRKNAESAEYVRSIYQQQGRAEGLEEGREEGREEGLNQKAMEIAKKALRKGMDVESVADLTELSIEVILQIKSEIDQS